MKNLKIKGMMLSSAILISLAVPATLSHADDVNVPDTVTEGIPTSYVVQNGEQSLENVLSTVSDNIDVNTSEQSISLENTAQLANSISQTDIDNINALSATQGLPSNLTKDNFVQTIDNKVTELNQQVQDGQLEVDSNGQLTNTSDSSFYVQGGSTKDITYWWGKARYKSTANANKWAAQLNGLAAVNAGVGVVDGAIFGAVGAIPNGLTSAYCWGLSNSISYRNSLNSRGIIANITWVLAYSIRSQ